MKKAFSLVELLIVVAILGILAAIAIPRFQGHALLAKEAAAKDNLRILRNAIELYAAQHNDVPPGYKNDDPSQPPSPMRFKLQMVTFGEYISEIPTNPFNGYGYPRIKMIRNDEEFPAEGTGGFAWIYKPVTKQIRLDWPGSDSKGVRYYDY